MTGPTLVSFFLILGAADAYGCAIVGLRSDLFGVFENDDFVFRFVLRLHGGYPSVWTPDKRNNGCSRHHLMRADQVQRPLKLAGRRSGLVVAHLDFVAVPTPLPPQHSLRAWQTEEWVVMVKIFRCQLTSDALFQTADAETAAPRLHPGPLPYMLVNVVHLALAGYRQRDGPIYVTGLHLAGGFLFSFDPGKAQC